MADNEVNVRMTAATGNAQQAWMAVIGLAERMDNTLRRMGRTGGRAGRQTQTGMQAAGAAVGRLGASIAAVAGVGGPLAAMYTMAQLIRKEMEAIQELQNKTADWQLNRSRMFAKAERALGTDRVDSQGQPFTRDDLDRFVQRESRGVISEPLALKEFETLMSAAGDTPADVVAAIPIETARAYPDLGLAESEEEATAATAAVLELIKARRALGEVVGIEDVPKFVSAMSQIQQQARATDLGKLPRYIQFIAGQAGAYGTPVEESTSQITALSNIAVDPEARLSGTNLAIFNADIRRIATEEWPEMKTATTTEVQQELRDATAEDTTERGKAMYRARKRYLGHYAPETTEEEIRRSGEFDEGEATGEEKMKPFVRQLLIKDSPLDTLYERNKKINEDMFTLERLRFQQAQLQEKNESPQMFPIHQALGQMTTEEAGFQALNKSGRSKMILDTAHEAIQKAEDVRGRAWVFGMRTHEVDKRLQMFTEHKDPEKLAQRKVIELEEQYIGPLQEMRAQEPPGQRRDDLAGQIDELETARRQIIKQYGLMLRERLAGRVDRGEMTEQQASEASFLTLSTLQGFEGDKSGFWSRPGFQAVRSEQSHSDRIKAREFVQQHGMTDTPLASVQAAIERAPQVMDEEFEAKEEEYRERARMEPTVDNTDAISPEIVARRRKTYEEGRRTELVERMDRFREVFSDPEAAELPTFRQFRAQQETREHEQGQARETTEAVNRMVPAADQFGIRQEASAIQEGGGGAAEIAQQNQTAIPQLQAEIETLKARVASIGMIDNLLNGPTLARNIERTQSEIAVRTEVQQGMEEVAERQRDDPGPPAEAPERVRAVDRLDRINEGAAWPQVGPTPQAGAAPAEVDPLEQLFEDAGKPQAGAGDLGLDRQRAAAAARPVPEDTIRELLQFAVQQPGAEADATPLAMQNLREDFDREGVTRWDQHAGEVSRESLRDTVAEARQQGFNAQSLQALQVAIEALTQKIDRVGVNGQTAPVVRVEVKEALNAPQGAPLDK